MNIKIEYLKTVINDIIDNINNDSIPFTIDGETLTIDLGHDVFIVIKNV